MVQKSIEIRDDQQKFLDEYPSINLSGEVRERIDELMGDKDYEK